jgi:hypothetical protein
MKPSVLKFVSTTIVPPIPTRLFAREKFVIDTRSNAPIRICFMDECFRSRFLSGVGKTEDPIAEHVLRYHELLAISDDSSFVGELGGVGRSRTTLQEMVYLLEKQGRGEEGPLLTDAFGNIFHIRDIGGVMCSICFMWDCRPLNGWRFSCDPFDNRSRRCSRSRVFSRD